MSTDRNDILTDLRDMATELDLELFYWEKGSTIKTMGVYHTNFNIQRFIGVSRNHEIIYKPMHLEHLIKLISSIFNMRKKKRRILTELSDMAEALDLELFYFKKNSRIKMIGVCHSNFILRKHVGLQKDGIIAHKPLHLGSLREIMAKGLVRRRRTNL